MLVLRVGAVEEDEMRKDSVSIRVSINFLLTAEFEIMGPRASGVRRRACTVHPVCVIAPLKSFLLVMPEGLKRKLMRSDFSCSCLDIKAAESLIPADFSLSRSTKVHRGQSVRQ